MNVIAVKTQQVFNLPNEEATAVLAQEMAAALLASEALGAPLIPLLVYLHGDLGAGKTFFVRSLLHALGFLGRVKSPTFTLMESYSTKKGQPHALNQTSNHNTHHSINIYHFDFYRFEDGADWRDAGFEEVLPGDGIAMVEWPEKAAGLPIADIEISLQLGESESERIASIASFSSKGVKLLAALIGLPTLQMQAKL